MTFERQPGMTEFDFKIAMIDLMAATVPVLQGVLVDKFIVVDIWDDATGDYRYEAAKVTDVMMMTIRNSFEPVALIETSIGGKFHKVDSLQSFFSSLEGAASMVKRKEVEREEQKARWARQEAEAKAAKAAQETASAATPRDVSAMLEN